MSLFPSLRAQAQSSTSGLTKLGRPVLSPFNNPSHHPYLSLRNASTSGSYPATSGNSTASSAGASASASASASARALQASSTSRSIQDVEKELAEQRQMMARAARTNPGMDIGTQSLPVLEPHVDTPPPFKYYIPYIGDEAFKQWKRERQERAMLTRQSLSEIISRKGFPEHRKSILSNVMAPIRNGWLILRRSNTIKQSIADMNKRYQEYMRIQAEGNIGQAAAISKDNALSAASHVIRTRKDKLRWQLIKENAKPYLVSSRLTVVDPRDMRMAAQLVLRFDTDQALITQKGNNTPTRRTQRVVENIIFEAFPINSTSEWKIKGKLVEAPTNGEKRQQ
ncbi:hypothetical protein I316_01992 [Kwoniella heveanensis BCC8398]|uniref:Tim44-like domain-containing protein n=1 Tax=Kwoniella heveanensis BCC8398 TaxID=1296120 RepID=A0A1B9GYP2_9TREE|nr:hypothetical protein I316_01992 [Kwoniella heveanensis BCC8398]